MSENERKEWQSQNNVKKRGYDQVDGLTQKTNENKNEASNSNCILS